MQEFDSTLLLHFIFKMSKIITNEQIENIKALIRNRNSYLDIKEVLDNLEDLPSQQEKKEDKPLSMLSSGATKQGGIKSQDDTKLQFPERSASLPADNPLADILKDLKELLHKGIRSQIHKFEIRDIINKYGEKQ